MNEKMEKRIAASLAKTLAMLCVRNTKIEEFHCGLGPITKTGDYSDVTVIHAGGETPWNEISKISDAEMKRLMKQVVNRLFTFYTMPAEYHLSDQMRRWKAVAAEWDEPEIDELLLSNLKQRGPPQFDEST